MGPVEKFAIKYKDSEGNITDRIISDCSPRDILSIDAYCHTRKAIRTFVISKIIFVADPETGEEYEDKYACFGLPSLTPKQIKKPRVVLDIDETPEERERRRRKEKHELFKPYTLEIIRDHYKNMLFKLFDNKCFKCGSEKKLVIDHNFPMAMGGRLIPGNLVVLCARCNSNKGTLIPESFYSSEELHNLELLLARQPKVMGFYFDWNSWNNNPRQYLESIGIEKRLIEEAFNNQESKYYIGSNQ